MADPQDFTGREELELEDGREAVLYDPSEAVEEWSRGQEETLTIGSLDGGLQVDSGEPLEQDESGKTRANSSGRIIAVPKRGQEEVFAHLKFPAVLSTSARDVDEAMDHARRQLLRIGLTPADFLSFNITTHYYQAPLGKRECGWSFSFEAKPFGLVPEIH